MLEAADVVEYTRAKQELQIIAETLFGEQLERFDLAAYIADPENYVGQFLEGAVAMALQAVAGEAYRLGQDLAAKAAKG